MSLPLRTITDGQPDSEGFAISDLFFHMEHAEYAKLMSGKKMPHMSDLSEAIENDAVKMQNWLAELGHEVTVAQLVNDFFDRL